jgi:colanic acid/amylovoran biosynthesis glycosyltransferase
MRARNLSPMPKLDDTTGHLVGRRLGVVVSRFPKLTETFVLQEILEMQRLGISVQIFPLMRHREAVVQPEVERLAGAAHFRSYLSARIWLDNLHVAVRQPRRYFGTLLRMIRGSRGSIRYLAGAVAFFPKAVSFARVAETTELEHVHAHFANHPAVAAMVIQALTGIPFSFTARGSDIHVDRTMLPEKLEAARLAVAVSRNIRDIIVRTCGSAAAKKVHVVYGGINTRTFASSQQRVSTGPFQMICIGRLEEVKGHAQLIEACAILARAGLEFTCHLLGDGELRPVLAREVARLGLRDRIVFHGNRTQRDVLAVLRASNVCVLATVRASDGKQEGIPNVLKEAMSCGLPVVSSQISGIPELVEDEVSGLLVPPQNPEALADALMRLAMDHALRDRMGRAGRARIERDFDLCTSTRRRAGLFLLSEADRKVIGAESRALRTG